MSVDKNNSVRVHCCLQMIMKCGINTYQTEITSRLLQYHDIDVDSLRVSMQNFETDTDFPVRHVKFPGWLAFSNHETPLSRKIISCAFELVRPFISFNKLTGCNPEDVFVFFDNAMTALPIKGKVITVLHDVIALHSEFPHNKGPFRKGAEHAVKKSAKIVTVSEFSRKDIAEQLKIDPSKIDVVYNAVDAEKFSREKTSAESLRALREKYGLPEKYILHLSRYNPRKNVKNFIRAYSMLPDKLKEEYGLVITNPNDEVRKFAGECGVSSRVIYVDDISDSDKPGIYQLSSLFVWPSFMEGFGLPILEAQASGIPVVSSNTSSMPEVAEDSAVYFDPYDVEGMSQAMAKCLDDEVLRGELVAKGYENLKRFSWDKSAKKFHDIIKNL